MKENRRDKLVIPGSIAGCLALVFLAGAWFQHRAAARMNRVALAASPKRVSVVKAGAAIFRPTHRYVGTLRPWVEAKIGPQFIAAYVDTVLVRPGAVVTRNQVLGTLDCRDASARSRAIDLQARGMQAEQQALSSQAQRMTGLLDGGYIAFNDVEQNTAQSNSEQSRLEAERARLVDAQLSVNDCVLRAPFDGDVGERWVDPGAFVRPGEPVVSLVNRDVIRLVVDVPEDDYAAVAPGHEVEIHLLALDRQVTARISRRSPSADPATRTIHTEIDLPDRDHLIPVNTTAEVRASLGQAQAAVALPVVASDLSQDQARIFTVENSIAHPRTLTALGEAGGHVYFLPSALPEGTEVVLEGRAALVNGDRVEALLVEPPGPPIAGPAPGPAPGEQAQPGSGGGHP